MGAARGARPAVWAFLGYLALSALYLGSRVVADPTHRVVGGLFTDQQIYVWSFAWWPHAILAGQNPFYTHALWAPNGANLAWVTSIPALAVPLAPLTLAFGPVFSYNVACILMPALAAWSTFLLCRYLTGRMFPALVGGYLFGFSSYVLSGELSHVHSAAVFPLPLAALLIVRFARRELSTRRFIVLFGVLLAVQLGLATELLFELTVALFLALVLAALVARDWRRALPRLLPPLAASYALAAALTAPFVYYIITSPNRSPNPVAFTFSADLLNYVIPTRASLGGCWFAGITGRFPGNDVERGAYLGLPALLIVAWFAVRCRRQPRARFLVAGFVVAMIASLGPWLTVDDRRLLTLPWSGIAQQWPFAQAMPVRFAAFCALAAAVIVAVGVASTASRSWLRVALSIAAAIAIVPNVGWSAWARMPDVPALFTTDAYRQCIPHNANVIVFPIGPSGDSMIWQADSGFWFRIAGGYLAPAVPASFLHPAGITHLTTNDNPSEITAAAVRELARLKGASTVIVDASEAAVWRPILRPLGAPQEVDGTLIYRLTRSRSPSGARAQSCGRG